MNKFKEILKLFQKSKQNNSLIKMIKIKKENKIILTAKKRKFKSKKLNKINKSNKSKLRLRNISIKFKVKSIKSMLKKLQDLACLKN